MKIKSIVLPHCLLFCLFLTPLASATTVPSPELVVTATGFSQSIFAAPASITVISQEDLQQGKFNNLAEALRDVEGIDVFSNTGKTGGLNISIRGMPADYTLVLIDGKRQNNSSNVTPNGFNETANSFIPPLAAIERIEVIRGPMSTLYGSDAIGGVVNIITRKIPTKWTTAITLDYGLAQQKQVGATGNISLYSAGNVLDETLGVMFKGRFNKRNASYLKARNYPELVISQRGPNPVAGESYQIGGRLLYQSSNQNHTWLEWDSTQQHYNNSQSQLGTLDTPTRAWGYKDKLHFDRYQWLLGRVSYFQRIKLKSTVTYTETTTKGRSIPSDAAKQLQLSAGSDRQLREKEWLINSNMVLPFGDGQMITAGLEFRHTQLVDGLIAKRLKTNLFALFLEDEWRLGRPLTATLGLRYDHHQTFGSHFSPRGYLVWNTLPNITFKGGVSQGYKTPNLERLYNGVFGVTRQGRVLMVGNPELKPEVSTTYEIGAYYDNQAGLSGNISYFYNDFRQKILSRSLTNCAANPQVDCLSLSSLPKGVTELSKPFNIGRATTSGIELAGTWQWLDNVKLNVNYTYTKTKQKSGRDAGMPLTYVPTHMAYAKITWNLTDDMTSWLSAEYRRGAPRFIAKYANLSVRNRAEYDLLGDKLHASLIYNLGMSYYLHEQITVNAVVYNLLNKNFLNYNVIRYRDARGMQQEYVNRYIRSEASTIGYLQTGRQFWLGIDIHF